MIDQCVSASGRYSLSDDDDDAAAVMGTLPYYLGVQLTYSSVHSFIPSFVA